MLQRLGVANAFVLGALAVAIPLTAAEVNLSAVPRWLTNVAQLLLGCALGARFERSFLRRAPRFVAAVVLSVGAAMAISAVFGVAMAEATGLHPATLVLATAPGGIAEMSITAKVLDRISRFAGRDPADVHSAAVRLAAAPAAQGGLAATSCGPVA